MTIRNSLIPKLPTKSQIKKKKWHIKRLHQRKISENTQKSFIKEEEKLSETGNLGPERRASKNSSHVTASGAATTTTTHSGTCSPRPKVTPAAVALRDKGTVCRKLSNIDGRQSLHRVLVKYSEDTSLNCRGRLLRYKIVELDAIVYETKYHSQYALKWVKKKMEKVVQKSS